MYPWYKGYLPDYKLSRDDTQQIQALFGECTFRKPYHLEGIVDITFTKKIPLAQYPEMSVRKIGKVGKASTVALNNEKRNKLNSIYL